MKTSRESQVVRLLGVWAVALLPAVLDGCAPASGNPSESAVLANATEEETADAIPIEAQAPVQQRQIEMELELIGTLVPWSFSTISAEVDGTVRRIAESGRVVEATVGGRQYRHQLTLDIGHEVRRGDVLVEIDPTDYQLQLQIAQAKEELARNQLAKLLAWERDETIKQLQAQLAGAQAELEKAQSDLARYTSLRERGVVSESEYEAVLTRQRAADAAVKQAQAALEMSAKPTAEEIAVAESQVKLAAAEVALWQEKVDKCTIRCPLDQAVITERHVGVGDRVTSMPATPILELVDPTILFAEVAVPQQHQGRVRLDDPVLVRIKGLEREVPGLVCLVNQKIDPSTRTFRVRVAIDNSQLGLKSGSLADIVLTLHSAADAMVVPAGAVSFVDGMPTVFVLEPRQDGLATAVQRRVALGLSTQSEWEILSGVAPGEQVAVGNGQRLGDGAVVRLPSDGATATQHTATMRPEASATGERTMELTR